MNKIKIFLSLFFVCVLLLLVLFIILLIIFNAPFLFVPFVIILLCLSINKFFTQKVKNGTIRKIYQYFILLLNISIFSAILYSLNYNYHNEIVSLIYENKTIIILICIVIGVSILEKINS